MAGIQAYESSSGETNLQENTGSNLSSDTLKPEGDTQNKTQRVRQFFSKSFLILVKLNYFFGGIFIFKYFPDIINSDYLFIP